MNNRVIRSADWPYRWLISESAPPNRRLLAAWSVLCGVCLATVLLASLAVVKK